jgi:serine phosphatase RsbU (regulator of sigma subunit)
MIHSQAMNQFKIQRKIDSLEILLKNEKNKQKKVDLLVDIARNYVAIDMNTALSYLDKSLETLGNQPDSTWVKLHMYKANIYKRMNGQGKAAINEYLLALQTAKKMNDSILIGSIYYELGIFNVYQGDMKLAESYFFKCNDYSFEKSDNLGKANIFLSLSFIYSNQDLYKKADSVMFLAYQYANKTTDYQLISTTASNYAENKWTLGQKDSALIYIDIALKLNEKIHFDLGIAWCNYVYGQFYLKDKQYKKSDHYLTKSIQIWESIQSYKDLSKYGYDTYAKVKAHLGDYQSAYEILLKLRAAEDTMSNQQNIEFLTEMEKKYQKEKDSMDLVNVHLKLDKERIKSEKTRQSKQRLLVFFSCIGLILLINAMYFFVQLKKTKKTNRIIEEQNNNLAIKNKEISDSIVYAKRIQEAILPSRFSLAENLQSGFVLFKPKDIVSGDFYWLEKHGQYTFIAAADCTGHGVPGAMVSVVCSNALSKALLEENITDTGKLLDRTRELVIEKFENSEEGVKDGMDISLFRINGNQLQWSGANNPLWIYRKNIHEIQEIKANKQAIGSSSNPKPFTSHNLELEHGDCIYVFTDGYADQFGGKLGKKFKYKTLKEFILTLQDKNLNEQKEALNLHFETWKGNLEQVDDVCIIGVKL